MTKNIIIAIILIFSAGTLFGQEDTRYDSDLNLPFNQKAGDVNPQTGAISLSSADVSLPGRAGMNFSFGRIWNLSQANAFNMYYDFIQGTNRLDSQTLERLHHLGIGWSSTLPVIQEQVVNQSTVTTLFMGGAAYELDRGALPYDNPDESNILGYDLVDKRIFYSTVAKYSQFVYPYDDPVSDPYDGVDDLVTLKTEYPEISDNLVDQSAYEMVFTDNSRMYFRADGKIMMHQDKSGLNRIWYFYNDQSQLVLVVDTIGREIRFSYNSLTENLELIQWDVDVWKEGGAAGREKVRETRSVQYEYEDTSGFAGIQALLGGNSVIDPIEPYVLKRKIDTMGHVTEYNYEEGQANFSFNTDVALETTNYFLLLTDIYSVYSSPTVYLNGRHFEYSSADDMPTRFFYSGYREYYKIARQYVTNRHQEILNDTSYFYYDDGEKGNRNVYTAVIKQGNVSTTYTYNNQESIEKRDTLASIDVQSKDGFRELRSFGYDAKRAKNFESVERQGEDVYSESFFYTIKGQLKTHIDKNKVETNTKYDPNYGIPVQSDVYFTDRYGSQHYTTTKIINDLGQVEKEIIMVTGYGADGITVSDYDYDAYGNPVAVTNADGKTVYTTFDSVYHAFPVKISQDVTISSWSQGDVHANWMIDPDGKTTAPIQSWTVFNSDGTTWLQVDNDGYAVETFYDALGTPIKTVNPDNNDIITFDQTQDDFTANTNFNAFCSSRLDNPGSRMDVDYQSEYIYTVADLDLALGHVTEAGVQKDGLGNVEKEIQYDRDGSDNLLEHSVKEMVYDNQGRMIALHDPDRGASFSTMEIHGKSVQRYDKTWLVKYDDLGRQVAVLYPETETGRSDIKRMSYDDYENSKTTIDPSGRKVYERMDWNGNLVEVIAYGDRKTLKTDVQTYKYEYDGLNRKTAFTDPKGIVTTYRYDERSLLLEQNYGNGSDTMVYDILGQLKEKRDRKGIVLAFKYDELGRNTALYHYNNEADFQADSKVDPAFKNPARAVFTEYDKRGNAVRVHSDDLIEHYIYDHSNRVTSLDRRLVNQDIREKVAPVWGGDEASQIFSFSYQYNEGGMVKRMVYPDGSIHDFEYDESLLQLKKIREGADEASIADFISNLDYNKSGVVERMDYGNGNTQTWGFDNRKRIKKLVINNGTSNIEEMDYSYDGSGDILSINNNSYQYDGFGRIVGATTYVPGTSEDYLSLVRAHFGTHAAGDPVDGKVYNAEADLDNSGTSAGKIDGSDYMAAVHSMSKESFDIESFSYDKNGNRTKLIQNNDEYKYSYGERNKLLSIEVKYEGSDSFVPFAEYQYDTNGNTIKRTIHGKESLQVINFQYDTMNRLVQTIETTTKGAVTENKTASYSYDNAGNRFIKIDGDGDTTLYLRHGQIAVAMDVVIKADQSEERGEINRYILSGDLVAGRITVPVDSEGNKLAAEYSYYHLDHLNSTKMVTDENGEIVVNYIYRAFGEQLKRLDAANQETSDEAVYSYGGKELDDNTNLYYFNARYYDATIGRFINVDPIQDGSNWYVYCSNNPLIMVDPTGLEFYNSVSWWTGVGGTAVTLVSIGVGLACPPAGVVLGVISAGFGATSAITGVSEAFEADKIKKQLNISQEQVADTTKLLGLYKADRLYREDNEDFKNDIFENALNIKRTAVAKDLQAQNKQARDEWSKTHNSGKGMKLPYPGSTIGEIINNPSKVFLTDEEKRQVWEDFGKQLKTELKEQEIAYEKKWGETEPYKEYKK